ncbi:MAG: glycosyltransferase family 39 protein, partial [Acidobacteria bacterium]|nr:glycosyltransferase family 39 protein [Acidobacteriota bacterium]
AAGWTLIAGAALELCAREVARTSIVEKTLGADVVSSTLVLVSLVAAGLVAVASRRPGVARAPLIFAVLFVVGVALQLHLGARLQSDGFYYFAYLRSLTFDRDVDFTNDYKLLGLGEKAHLFNPTPTGHAQSAWTIGPAILWAPFFAAAAPVAHGLSASGADVSTNGISYPYRQAVCIAGLVYGLLGSWFIYRLVCRFFVRRYAAAATVFAVCGSFMLWYIVKEPSMTHAPSMAGVAGFIWMWVATRERRTLAQWALLGALAGFITLIRWQNALFAIMPASEALATLVAAWRTDDRARLQSTLAAGLLFTACATLSFMPQMLAWRAIYGSYLAVSPVGPQIRWWDPHLVDIIWSSRNGLFSWSPVIYGGAIGLLIFTVARPAVGVPMLLSLAAMTYFNASIQDWWGSAGFGARRFDGTLPLFALGMAAVIERGAAMARRFPFGVVSGVGALLVAWNIALIRVAQDGHVRLGEAVSFGSVGAHQVRALHGWVGNPFTYPASLMFAAKNDVAIGLYDVVDANRFLGDATRPYGRIDVGGEEDEVLLEDGWHQPEKNGETTFRWADSPATVLVPLDHAARLAVQVRMQAFNYPGATPQAVTLRVNGHAQPIEIVPDAWGVLELIVEQGAWRAGVNRLRLEFSRATRPADVGLGGDTRRLSAGIDYVRVQVR